MKDCARAQIISMISAAENKTSLPQRVRAVLMLPLFRSSLWLIKIFCVLSACLYNEEVSVLTMAINVIRNKQGGPGGGTRRLHQFLPDCDSYHQNGLRISSIWFWGRNRIDACSKGIIFARYGNRRYRANVVVANDNTAPVAVAA